ncbi:MAG: beta-hydroxyacyl-ACP dehydratase [Bacteroidetes bacterium]|nr:beta-hydroxyacyl-ACP dehydratase [Bacteroidota bacterium]MCL1968742.1 beta-hydroxyacyl-ACP dehydratase [Bacteroidota bacterium]
MTQEEIKNYLPHREPMLLVDEINIVQDEQGNDFAQACYYVTGYEYFLEGHFPKKPVVPGVILCEIMGQSASMLMKDELIGRTPFFTGMTDVRFKRPAEPHDTLDIKARIYNRRALIFFVEATIHINGELCASGKFTFALVDNERL